MRAVFIGASILAKMTARILLRRGHEVVMVEKDVEDIEALRQELDCGVIHGDGSKPAILREADPENTNFLFCLTDNDQTNMLASLVGRSLGFKRIVTKIDDPEFEHICLELGLQDTIIPSRTIGHYLADTFQGMNLLDLFSVIHDEARLFTFIAHDEEAVAVGELNLPTNSRVVCLYRADRFVPVTDATRIQAGDQVVVITHSEQLDKLRESFSHPPAATEA